MARTGPVTKNASFISLGFAQIRIGAAAKNIATATPVLTADDSIGAMASTQLTRSADFYRFESGFPALEDAVYPLRESATMECAFNEISPANFMLACGLDPTTIDKTGESYDPHAGTITLGTLSVPKYVRMEAVYTYPDGNHTMTIIFPRAQVTSNTELDFQAEEAANVPITIEAKRSDSESEGGDAAWDAMPLGTIIFA